VRRTQPGRSAATRQRLQLITWSSAELKRELRTRPNTRAAPSDAHSEPRRPSHCRDAVNTHCESSPAKNRSLFSLLAQQVPASCLVRPVHPRPSLLPLPYKPSLPHPSSFLCHFPAGFCQTSAAVLRLRGWCCSLDSGSRPCDGSDVAGCRDVARRRCAGCWHLQNCSDVADCRALSGHCVARHHHCAGGCWH